MCNINNIRLEVLIFSWIKLIFSVYVFGVGAFFASSSDIQQAFGEDFLSIGVSLIFLSLLSAGVILPLKYGVNKHNRFVLLVVFLMDAIVFAEFINLGFSALAFTVPEFPLDLQEDCSLTIPQVYSREECEPFYRSDRTAGFRLVWVSHFSNKNDPSQFQVLTELQGTSCCGYFAPRNCIENLEPYPSGLQLAGISRSLTESRVQCGISSRYYPEQDNCEDLFSIVPRIVGGCDYDLGVGFCLDNEVGAGCAPLVEEYVVLQVQPHALLVVMCSAFNALSMLFACCMWWKRKESDIFPEFGGADKVRTR